jgi:hypothetical protein
MNIRQSISVIRRLPRPYLLRWKQLHLRIVLPCQGFPSDPLADDTGNRFDESASIIVFALVESKRLLVQIAEKMERLDVHISSLQGTFEQAPEILQPVRVWTCPRAYVTA